MQNSVHMATNVSLQFSGSPAMLLITAILGLEYQLIQINRKVCRRTLKCLH